MKPGSNNSNSNFYIDKNNVKREFDGKLGKVTYHKPMEYATPIGDRVLVKVKQKEIQTTSGLAVVQTNPVLPIDGIVVAVGDDPKIECKVGDRVTFGKYAGVELRLNDEDHIVMYTHEVLGLVE